jgi:ribonuclease HI
MIEIFTDGASKGNPGPGGYGVILQSGGHKKELSEGFRLTTNNRMELLAVIRGLEAIKSDKHEILIYSDSKYVVDAVQLKWIDRWQRTNYQKIKNPDLWIQLYALLKKYQVRFIWVKGHNGHPENEKCDELAVKAATQTKLKIDENFEKLKNGEKID